MAMCLQIILLNAMNIVSSLQYTEEEFKGFRTRTSSAPNFEGTALPHDPAQCLECALTHRQRSSSSLSSLPQQTLLAGPAQSSGGSHATDTSSTAGSGGGSYVSKDKSLDATPSPDAPRTLHLHVGSSQENVADGGESDGGGGARGGASTTPKDGGGLMMKELAEKKRGYSTSGSPLVRMKKILSEERIEEVGADEEDREKWTGERETAVPREEHKARGCLKEVCEDGGRVGPVKEQGGGGEDSSVIKLTPPLGDGGDGGGSLGEGEGGEGRRKKEEGGIEGAGEEEKREGVGEGEKEEEGVEVGDREEREREKVKEGEGKREGEEEGEGDDGMTTEDDETDDEELEEEGEEEEEEEEEGDDSISPVKEILINVVSARSVTMRANTHAHTHTSTL